MGRRKSFERFSFGSKSRTIFENFKNIEEELGMRYVNLIIIFLLLSCIALADEHSSNEKVEAGQLQANITTQDIDYQVDGVHFTGYLAYDSSITVKRPGVLVVHEWWGHNEYARRRAEMLAKLGYVALAVDMYGDGKFAEHPEDASKFMKEVTSSMPQAEKRLQAARKLLNQQEFTDSEKNAAIGYCFGGGMVLHFARIGADLDGVVSFHGSLGTQTPAKPDVVKARILVLHGADDPFIPTQQVDAFKEEMQRAGALYEFVAYPNVRHSFTNPQADDFGQKFNLPALQYNREADEDSWNRMKEFLETVFE